MKKRITRRQMKYIKLKRLLDFILSFGLCVVLSPVLLFLCIAIKADSRGPVFFRQKRVGIHKTFFSIYKFRTMRTDTPKDMPTHLLKDPDQYITKTGRFLRKSSLDELPQLFNILKGDMCIVGPRPPLPNEVELYTPYQRQRLHIKPGLTCYWQVTKHDRTTFDEWVEMDLKYIRERSFWTDIKLIFKSFYVVLHRKGDY